MIAAEKKALHDTQRETRRVKRLRREFADRLNQEWCTVLAHLKFIDGSGLHCGLTRLFGRAVPGQRVVEATPGHSGPHYTLIAALGWHGVEAPWILKGAMDGEAFEVYIAQVLAPTLQAGDIVFSDNLSFHHWPRIRRIIEATGAHLEFLPPYSPDFNPIELSWSKVKTTLRTAKVRVFQALLDALADALGSGSQQDIETWFAHCGYANP